MKAPVSSTHLPTVIEADFLWEVRAEGALPPSGPPEVAIAGRSNVGKSTLLNRLAGRRSLARTSRTPGRTRGLIFYDLKVRFADATETCQVRLADLPGYGYAKVSQDERVGWQNLVEGYVERCQLLKLVVLLIDARRDVEAEERQLLEWLASLGVRSLVVVTKVDKLSTPERLSLGNKVKRERGNSDAQVLLVSGHTGEGVDRLWAAIRHAIELVDGRPAQP